MADCWRRHSEVANRRVRLYREQFKAGKRTLFELLDSQMAYYSARQDQISNLHESLRAEYDILRTTGMLLTTLFPQ